jgi:hypothetical protein
MPEVLQSVGHVLNQKFIFADDIIEKIKSNKEAWKHYQTFSPSYKRVRVAFIEAARNRPEEFEKRLNNFIKKTEQNKMFGFGGIEEYY